MWRKIARGPVFTAPGVCSLTEIVRLTLRWIFGSHAVRDLPYPGSRDYIRRCTSLESGLNQILKSIAPVVVALERRMTSRVVEVLATVHADTRRMHGKELARARTQCGERVVLSQR